LYASNANITGIIKANTGYIGGESGWTVAAGSIITTDKDLSVNGSFHMYSTGYTTTDASSDKKYFGETENKTWALGIGKNFGVTTNGEIFANSGKIGAFEIGADGDLVCDYSAFDNGHDMYGVDITDNNYHAKLFPGIV
jgi:hypothetical protein